MSEVGLARLVLAHPLSQLRCREREAFFIGMSLGCWWPEVASAPQNSLEPSTAHCSYFLILAGKATFVLWDLLWIGLFVSFGYGFVNIRKHLYCCDFLTAPSWL